MPSRNSKGRVAQPTRQRILNAAAARFAGTSYEEVKLRDIARDVDVDVAYVHRCFGSKEQLFVEAFDAVCTVEQPPKAADLARAFSEDVFDDAIEFQIFANSLSSHQARSALRALGMKRFIEPMAARLSEQGQLRACLLAGCVTGIKVMREVLRMPPLSGMPIEECRPLLEAIFRACLEADGDLIAKDTTPSSTNRASKGPASKGRAAEVRVSKSRATMVGSGAGNRVHGRSPARKTRKASEIG